MRAFAMIAVLCGVGCGGGDGTSSTGEYSCDVTQQGAHTCIDYDWAGGDYPTSAWNDACTRAGGAPGDGCSHSGAVGGCELTTTAGQITVHTTSWTYTGQASAIMTGCTEAGGTFVTP